jgi:fumarate hydratase class II
MPESERKIHSGQKCLPATDKKYDTLAKNGQRFNQVANICWEILREANPCVLAQNVKGARTQRREREGKILMRLSVMRNLNIIK